MRQSEHSCYACMLSTFFVCVIINESQRYDEVISRNDRNEKRRQENERLRSFQ